MAPKILFGCLIKHTQRHALRDTCTDTYRFKHKWPLNRAYRRSPYQATGDMRLLLLLALSISLFTGEFFREDTKKSGS